MNEVILITARHKIKEIEELYHGNCNIMSFDSWFVIRNLEKYKEIEALFNDERSRDVLSLLLMAMLTGEHEKYCSMAYDDKQYFCLPQFVNGHNEYFIDAGSFVGDTLEQFIWSKAGNFNQIYCFEPGKRQFKSLQNRCNRLINEWAIDERKIILINAGLGNISHTTQLDTSNDTLPSFSLLARQSYQVMSENIPIYTIDEYFKDIPVSYIKVDIEGYEMKLLHGALNTIIKNKPKLALCTYHGTNDIFNFITFLSNIVPEYKFALRHHSFSILETVLYCFVE